MLDGHAEVSLCFSQLFLRFSTSGVAVRAPSVFASFRPLIKFNGLCFINRDSLANHMSKFISYVASFQVKRYIRIFLEARISVIARLSESLSASVLRYREEDKRIR